MKVSLVATATLLVALSAPGHLPNAGPFHCLPDSMKWPISLKDCAFRPTRAGARFREIQSHFGGNCVNWSKPLRVHLSVLVVALLLLTATPIIWMAFSQGRQAAILAGEKHMREMSLRLIEGYRNALEGGQEVDDVDVRRVGAAVEAVAHRYMRDGDNPRIDVLLLAPGRWPRHIVNAWQP